MHFLKLAAVPIAAFLFLSCVGNVFSAEQEVEKEGEEDNTQKHWALLVAGSNEYYNYRHQADICHAYHIIRKHGIPAERIVVMMFDDIAHNRQNPIQGNIINTPGGPNVYPGVVIDYSMHDVTPEVFLKVLTGDAEGVEKLTGKKGAKVIKSGPKDTVFVNFADHGAPGLIAFPDDVLSAKDLNDALVKMHANKQYKEMVLYIEACESGSMFENILSKDINVFAATAANEKESSWACYYDKTRETYLGDLFSVNWMNDSDVHDLNKETILKQFTDVKKMTNRSHVMKYGDMSMTNRFVGQFQGNKLDMFASANPSKIPNPNNDAVPAEEVVAKTLYKRWQAASENRDMKLASTLMNKMVHHEQKKQDVKFLFQYIIGNVNEALYKDDLFTKEIESFDFDCYTASVRKLLKLCPGPRITNDYHALKNFRVLANMCSVEPKEKILKAMEFVIADPGNHAYCNRVSTV